MVKIRQYTVDVESLYLLMPLRKLAQQLPGGHWQGAVALLSAMAVDQVLF